MGVERVPFNQPLVVGAEFSYIEEAIRNAHLSGNGPFSKRCCEWIERSVGGTALLTHSCTGALEMAALLAEVGPGDEVIMPSYTFSSTANAFVLRGAVPVFVDVRDDTLNLDERLVADAITERTRAICCVHYAGVACEMDALTRLAEKHGVALVEDAAQAVGSSYRGRPLGSFGNLSGFSFHETKNVICGEGGALVVNDPALVERAEILQEKGTNRSQFFRGQTDKYTWVDVGSSFLASEVAAAFLWAQLERAERINDARRAIWRSYHDGIADLELAGVVRRPQVPAECVHNGHLYHLRLASLAARDRLIEALAERGVSAVFHYVPLHSAPAGRRFGRAHGELPVTDAASDTLVRLPLWAGMAEAEVEAVVTAVRDSLR